MATDGWEGTGDRAEVVAGPPPSRRLRLVVAYDGTAFYGAQVQPGQRTVGGELEGALVRLTGKATRLTFAGRTDRGVHAIGQIAHCDLATRLDDDRLGRALNAVLPADLAVLRLTTVPPTFHARYGARWREYHYRIWNAPVRLPQLAGTTWHLRRPLDLEWLNRGAAALIGEHDFATFSGQGLGGPRRATERSTVRTVYDAAWSSEAPAFPVRGQFVELRIRANGFLPQMVRTIVGTLVAVGTGQRSVEWLTTILAARDRALAPAPAPPQGLTLWRVGDDAGPDDRVASDDGAAVMRRSK